MTYTPIKGRIQHKRDTTANWNASIGFVPLDGEIIIYTDYRSEQREVIENGECVTRTINVPAVKIGNGNAYVQDLPFVDDGTRDMLLNHIANDIIHINQLDRDRWDNKLNCENEVVNGVLVLNRL